MKIPLRSLLGALLLASVRLSAADHHLQSPNGRIAVAIHAADRITYDLSFEERPVMKGSALSLQVDERTFGAGSKVTAAKTRSHEGVVHPVVRQKAAQYPERYNELRLELEGGAAVVFRAYDEGVAYRWETALPQAEVQVRGEEVLLAFAGDFTAYYPEEQSFFSHNERIFLPRHMADLAAKHLASIPVVIDAGFVKLALCDADIEDYPGLWFRGTEGPALTGVFPPYPLREELTGDRDVRVVETAPFIAKTRGSRSYPWRVIGLAAKDGDLITNPLPYLLQAPSRIADPSWIKPGKVAWDWWNANNLTGVDFKSGVNTATYKAFIDFASENGIEYVVLDEGWYKLGNVLEVVPEIDVQELADYGRKRNVALILWVVWKTLDDQLEPALDQYAKWGVRGIKVDFMQRDDQLVMGHYHRVCREAAERRMLVDFHGAVRPALLTRTWPNLISTEGVRGNEWNKWSTHITPEHKASLPFTRMFVGPLDFTPGATLNANKGAFASNFDRPSSQGTRVNEMALYVVFESPLQMLCDSPSHYRREPEMVEFLKTMPTVWDETRVLDGRISDYVVVARRHGNDWFLGAITDWTGRDLTIDLSFLPAGTYQLDEFRDGVNAGRHAQDYKRVKRTVTHGARLELTLADGGGYVARLTPVAK